MNNVQQENFSFNSGDHKAWTITFYDKTNAKIDLNLRRIVLTCKADIDDTDSNATIKKVLNINELEPVYEYVLFFTTDETKELYGQFEYDIKVSFINNPTEIQYTALRGKLNIMKSVTEIMG